MGRKVIQQGPNTLGVSLPSTWIRSNSIRKGDEIEVDVSKHKLSLSCKGTSKLRKIQVNITEYDRSSFLKLLTSLYESGYDEIDLRFDRDEFLDYKINKKVKISDYITKYIDRLIGLEIISQGANNYLLKDISTENEREFENILRRIFFLIIEFHESVADSIKSDDYNELKKSFGKHENIHKFVSYCLRLLNKKYFENTIEKNNMFHIIISLNDIADYTRFCCEDIINIKGKLSSKTIDIISSVIVFFSMFYKVFYDFSVENLRQITKKRYQIKQEVARVKAKSHELILIIRFSSIVEITQSMLKSKLALGNLPK